MKKFFLFLTLLTLGVGQMWGADVTFTPGTDTGETSVNKSGVTCTMTTMNNASYYQIYANQSGTFSVSTGNITKIEFTCTASGTSKYGPGNTSANVGSYSYSGNKGTWTGEATSVTLSSTAQVRMSSLTVTYEAVNPASITLNPEGGTCAQSSVTEASAGAGVTLPNASPSPSCASLDWTFAGWAKTAITETTTAPTLYTGNYTPVDGETLHAVYKKTESSGGSSSGSQTFTFSSIASTNSWSNGVAYTPVTLSPVNLAGNGGGNNAKYYTSDQSWRMYSGGTVNISVEGGSVTSVSSTPSKTFTVSNGAASLSCSETIKFTAITVNYTVSGASITTYNSNPTCCTELASINGSVNVTNSTPTGIELNWNNVTTGVSSWTVKYKTHDANEWQTYINAKTTSDASITVYSDGGTNNKCKCTIPTSCGTLYDFLIIANPANGYCDNQEELNNNNQGYNSGKYAITKSGNPAGTVTGGIFITKIGQNAATEACGDATITLAATPTTGYSFTSWSVTKTNGGAEVSVTSNQFTMPAEAVTVNATFSKQHHNVVFHKNDGGEDETDTQDFTYGVAQNLKTISAIGWTRTNYNFGGWMTTSGGSSADKLDGASYTLNAENNVDLFALWVADNTRTISYSGESHITYSPAKPTTVDIQNDNSFSVSFSLDAHYSLNAVTVTMGDATLAANLISFDQSSLTVTAPAGGFTDNILVTYTIAATNYTVKFYINDVVTPFDTQEGVYNADMTVPADFSSFTDCSDFYFIGWKEGSAFDGGSSTSAPSIANVGTKITGNKDYYAVFAEGTPGSTTKLLNEDFAACEGTGGNDTQGWSGNIASNDLPTSLTSTWTFSNSNAANGCAKCGAGSKLGTATTPELALTGAATLTFKAAAWNGNSESTNLKLSAEGATLKQNNATISSVTMTKGAWTSYTVDITGGNGEVTITFEGNGSSNARFFLDDVVVSQEVAASWTKYYTTCPHCNTVTLEKVYGTNPANGSITLKQGNTEVFAPVETCEGQVTINVTSTPDLGYQLSSLTVGGIDGASYSNGIITIPQNGDGTLNVTATFVASPSAVVTDGEDHPVSALDFGTPKKDDAVPAEQTFVITGANLTSALTVVSSAPSLYEVSYPEGALTPVAQAVSATITVTPQAGITSTAGTKSANITISGGGLASPVVIPANMTVQETYTVNWYVNGNPTPARTQTDIVGTDLTNIPSDFSGAADCSDLTFMGWTEDDDYSHTTDAPADLITSTAGMKITAENKNYYAVFAEPDGDEVVTWTRVTAVNTLLAGGTFIMGYEETANSGVIVPMQNTGTLTTSSAGYIYSGTGTNTCNTGTLTMSEGVEPSSKYEITIVASEAVDGAINIKFGSNFLGNENTKNNAKLYNSDGATTAFTPNIGTNDAFTLDIEANTSGSAYRYLKYNNNSGSERFAVYSTTPEKIVFYQKGSTASNYINYTVVCPHYPRVALNAISVENGSISFAQSSKVVTIVRTDGGDAVVDVVASPATGYELKDLTLASEDITGATKNVALTQITIPEDEEGTLNVTATFGLKDYTVTVNQTEGAGAKLSGAADDAHYGATINLSATEIPANAQFVNWTSSDVTITNPTSATEASFTMPAKNVTVTANFLEIHNVAWANENTPSSGKSDFVYVKGIVTGITEISTEHGNATYYISDLDENGAAANSYLVFRAKKEGNTDYTSNTQLKEGDEVIVYGKLMTYQSTKEFDQGGYIIANGRTAATFDVVVSGTATKTDYFAGETFAYAGLTAKAEYSTGYKKTVTPTWKANNVASYTVNEAGTVNVTATWNEETSEDFPVVVTVTTKTLESIELSETELTGYKGQALPKPTTVTAHFDDQGAKSTEPVAAFAIYDEANVYDASSTNAQTIQVKYSFGLNTRTANYTVTLSPVRNTLETAYTVAKGIEIIDVDRVEGNNLALDESANKAFVTGLVTAISSNKYTIKDNAENEAFIEIYEGTLVDGISSVVVGDLIKVEGNLYFFENNTHTVQKYQIMNGEIVRVVRTPNFTIADVAEMEVNITADLAEADLTIERGDSEGAITFSCSDAAVTIVDNKLHAAAAGDATVTATMAANGGGAMSYGEATATFNVHVIAERQRYAVNFDANGGSGDAPVVANQLPGVPVDLPANTFTKTDMRFTGWVVTETESGDAVEVEAGHFTMPEAAVTLTAQWEAKTYCALTLRINGVDQTPFNVERLEDNDLSGHNPEAINGYEFYGWAVLDSDVEDEVTEAITILPNHIFTPAANEESKTLYAVFKKAESGENKHFVLDYTADVADKSISYGTEVDVTATDGSQWVVMASKQQSMQINTGKDAYIQVPNCPAEIVKILLSCRTGATAAAAFSTTSDGEAIVTATGTTTQTLNFSEVHVSAGYIIPYDGNCQITHIDVEYSGNFAYYTTRPVVRHMVTYDANGGSNAPAASKTDVNGKVTVTSATPTAPADKVFYCWSANENGTGAIYWAGDKVSASDADVTIYAIWRDQPTKEAIATVGGKFIINNLGDTAVFSRGNLQHQLSTNTWRCAPNQYEWAGEVANEQMGNPNYEGWVDLFSWSIGAENNYGATSAYHPSLYFNKEFVDWGSLFTGDWSTLSINEWTYMLYDRPNANNLWGMAMIGDTLGMVLLPGDWTAPSGVTFVAGTMPTTDMWYDEDQLDPTHQDIDRWRLNPENMPANKFTTSEWTILENAGAVFCPYGGRRSGGYGNHTNRLDETVDYEYNYTYWENYYGAYWTSTVHNAAEGKVYWLPTICKNCDADHENWGRGTGGWWENGRYGHSVRLVHVIPRQYTVTYDANGATSGSVPVNENKYLNGATVPVVGKGDLAKEGYVFMGWKFKNQIYQAGETYTISGVKYNEEIVFEAQWQEPQLSEYVLVTKPTQMKAGDKIIIAAAGDYDFAMGTQNSGNYRDVVDVLKKKDGHLYTMANAPVEFTLGMEGNYYTFYDGMGYLSAQQTDNNRLNTEASLTDYGRWSIEITDSVATVVAQGSSTRNHMRYNNTSGQSRISCYASTNTFPKVAIYVKPGDVEVTSGNVKTEDIAQNSNVIMNQDTLKVTESKELSDLTLGLQAVVNVEEGKTLETKDLTIKSTAGESTQLTGVVENVTYSNFYLEINFYKTAETLDAAAANQWYMISAPFDVALNGGFFQTDGTPMVFGQDFDLFEYDGSKRADTGVTGWRRAQGKMNAGVACLIGFNEDQSTTIRLKAMTTQLSNPTSITLNEYAGDAANSNWNGVANPSMRHIDVDQMVYVYNNDEGENGRKYLTYSADQMSYVVGRAFFVQNTGSMTIDEAHHDLYAPKREAANTYSYCVRITRNEASQWADQIFVRASEDATNEYKQGRDMSAMNGTSAPTALLWTNNYGTRLTVEEAPLVNKNATYDLGIYAPKAGTYTISVEAPQENATLYLTKNGRIYWNLTMGACELDLNQGQNNEYGLVLRAEAPEVSTGIENGELLNGANGVQKVIIDEHVYILRGGEMYDMTGKMVK